MLMTKSWLVIEEKLNLHGLGDVIAEKVVRGSREKEISSLLFFSAAVPEFLMDEIQRR